MVQTPIVLVAGAETFRQRTAVFIESGIVVSFVSPVVVADHMTG